MYKLKCFSKWLKMILEPCRSILVQCTNIAKYTSDFKHEKTKDSVTEVKKAVFLLIWPLFKKTVFLPLLKKTCLFLQHISISKSIVCITGTLVYNHDTSKLN